MKVSFRKTTESAIEPSEVGFCEYNIHPLNSYNVEPLERTMIRTGICFNFPKPKKILVGPDVVYEHVTLEITPKENLFVSTGLLLLDKTINHTHEGEITIEVINMTLPDFLLYNKEAPKSVLARAHFFGSTNSARLGKEDPMAKLRINIVQSAKAS